MDHDKHVSRRNKPARGQRFALKSVAPFHTMLASIELARKLFHEAVLNT